VKQLQNTIQNAIQGDPISKAGVSKCGLEAAKNNTKYNFKNSLWPNPAANQ
jgi:hypothetical protein